MKTLRFIAILALASIVGAAQLQGQSTPQAVIDATPALPTPEQWAANTPDGHTEAFRARIEALAEQLARMRTPLITLTEADLQEARAAQQRQQQEAMRNMQAGIDMAKQMGITQADLERLATMSQEEAEAYMIEKVYAMPQMRPMTVLREMGFTVEDLKQLETMDEAQGEAYIKRRLAELGISEAEFRRRMEEAGAKLLTDAEMEEIDRKEREAEELGQAIAAVQQALENWVAQNRIAVQRLEQAADSLRIRIESIEARYQPQIDKLQSQISERYDRHDVQPNDPLVEQLEAQRTQVVLEFREASYDAWRKYVHSSQGTLRTLLPYGAAADEAQRTLARITAGNTAIMRLQSMPNYAVDVAIRYLHVTLSQPKL